MIWYDDNLRLVIKGGILVEGLKLCLGNYIVGIKIVLGKNMVFIIFFGLDRSVVLFDFVYILDRRVNVLF